MAVVNFAALPETFSSQKAHCFVDELFLSSQLKGFKHNVKGDDVDGSVIGTRTKNNLIGQLDGTITFDGHASLRRGGSARELRRRLGKDKPVCATLLPEGMAVGKPAIIQPSRIKDASVEVKENETAKIDGEASAAGIFVDGFVLATPRDLVPSGASWTSPVDDNLEATNFGGLWQFHLLALDGGTTPTVTPSLVHSADTTFTACGDAGTAMSKPGAQHMIIPSVIPILAKTKLSLAITGSPTAVQVMFVFGRLDDPES